MQPLIAVLGDEEYHVRREAAKALKQLGGALVVEPLIAALGDKKPRVREEAADVLGALRDARAVEPLIVALESYEPGVRGEAAEALGLLGAALVVEPLIAALGGEKPGVREGAAEVLGQLGDVRAVQPLIAVLGDDDSSVRRQAGEALGQLGWRPVNDSQRAQLAVAARHWEEAVGLGSAAVEPLAVALGGSYSDDRPEAAEALGLLGDVRAVEPLIAHLGHLASRPRQTRRYDSRYLDALRRALEPSLPSIDADILRLVAALHDFEWEELMGTEGCTYRRRTISCSDVRQLARQELIRRGLEA